MFSGRGAFIHVGALVGTIMAANVFAIIIPNQKKMMAHLIAGQTPEARFGVIGKQRSIHNNYLTLPVLLMMVSQHYPFLFSHPQSWLVVALILFSGGLTWHFSTGSTPATIGTAMAGRCRGRDGAARCDLRDCAAGAHRGGRYPGDRRAGADDHEEHCTMCHARHRPMSPSGSRRRMFRSKLPPRCGAGAN